MVGEGALAVVAGPGLVTGGGGGTATSSDLSRVVGEGARDASLPILNSRVNVQFDMVQDKSPRFSMILKSQINLSIIL